MGRKCLNLVATFLTEGANRSLRYLTKKKIYLTVIPHLNSTNVLELPRTVLTGLTDIMKDDELCELFIDTVPYMMYWLKEVGNLGKIP